MNASSDERDVNLGLVAHTGHTSIEDFQRVAQVARERSPRVRAIVLRDRPNHLRRRLLARRPSMFFAARPFSHFRPVRGTVFTGVGLMKSQEYRRLETAGIRVPRWALLTEHETPDLTEFGPYVVVKPDSGARGATVKIVRRNRVRWKPPEFVSTVYEGSTARLVQDFIYTGRWPVSYRIQTVCGEAVCGIRIEAHHDRIPLEERYDFKQAGGGRTIVASSKGCGISLCDDADLVEIAERASGLFPECAMLGVDLIREVPTGEIYVLEVNARGGGWLLSSASLNEACGADLRDQRDGLARVGRVLADAALRLAE